MFVMMFYCSRNTPPDNNLPNTATVRLWGSEPTVGNPEYAGTPLGDLKLKMGLTPGVVDTPVSPLNRFVCDIRVIPPDISLTPPGIRVVGQNSSRGAAHVIIDSLGFTHIIAQIIIDTVGDESNIAGVGLFWRTG